MDTSQNDIVGVLLIYFIFLIGVFSGLNYSRTGMIIAFIIVIIMIMILQLGNGSTYYPTNNEIVKINYNDNVTKIGGMDSKLDEIYDRILLTRKLDKETFDKLGVRHVKGLMLYGPPGTGKTIMAMNIAKKLKSETPVIIDSSTIVGQFIGDTEANIKNIFRDAFENNGKNGKLYVYIMDEFDAIGSKRSSNGNSSSLKEHNKIVNQLLAVMDGPKALNNVLIIGITNKIEDIDRAFLRTGRFEVKMEIPLPNIESRKDIFDIKLSKLKDNNFLDDDVNTLKLAELTPLYSGADIEGVVNIAVSNFIKDRLSSPDNKIKHEDIVNIITT